MRLGEIFGIYTSICMAFIIIYAVFDFPYAEIVGTTVTAVWLLGLFIICPIFLLLNNPYKHDVKRSEGEVKE